MNKVITLVTFFCVLFFSAELSAGIGFEGEYISIDSLSDEYNSRYVFLDLKTRQIDLFIGEELRTFSQSETFDPGKVSFSHGQSL